MRSKILTLAMASMLTLSCFACTGGGAKNSSSSNETTSSVINTSTNSSTSTGAGSSNTIVSESTSASSSTNTTASVTTSSSSATPTCTHGYEQLSFTAPTLTTAGTRVFKCSNCQDTFSQTIPILNTTDYEKSSVAATTTNAGMDIYVSAVYGTYTVETSPKLDEEIVEEMLVNTGNLVYSQENISDVYVGTSSYPRLYELQDGTWICGFDTWGTGYTNGTIVLVRSTDKGKTWTKTVTRVSQHELAICANVAFFQMDNGDILCGYRALGSSVDGGDPLSKALHVAISKDNGFTWAYHSTITDAYNLKGPNGTSYSKSEVQKAIQAEGRLGFFEPHFGVVNGQITVMYADDLTTWMENPRNIAKNADGSYPSAYWKNYETQYIIKRTLNGTTWSEPKVVLDGTKQKTIGNDFYGQITDYSRDGMPVFDKLSDGTYVLVVEGTYRDRIDATGATKADTVKGGLHDFNIYISYSKEGENWSNPTEVYIPYTNNTKASAPYVCVTSDDRIVISFQTNEDANQINDPDGVSIMKTIISDGTPVDKITGPENFYESTNPYFAPAGSCYSWNGMMMDKKTDTLYCVSGANAPYGAVKLSWAKIPELVPQNYQSTTDSTDFTVRSGSYGKQADGWYRSTSGGTLLTTSDSLVNGTIEMDIVSNSNSDCGLIFKVSSTVENYWEQEGSTSYYLALVNKEGWLLLGKITNGEWTCPSNYLIPGFNVKNKYNIKVDYNDAIIKIYLNGQLAINYWERGTRLSGTGVGVRTANANTVFTMPQVTSK